MRLLEFIHTVELKNIVEVFDTVVDYDITSDSTSYTEYHFTIDERDYFVEFEGDSKSQQSEISFGVNYQSYGAFKPTGFGSPTIILSTVVAIIRDYVKRHDNVSSLQFTGDKWVGLSTLYDKMVPYMAKKLNFEYQLVKHNQKNEYIIYIDKNTNVSEAQKPWLRQTPTMIDQAKGNKSQVIVEISPKQFLMMTTGSQEGRDQIMQFAHSLKDYNRWAKVGHDKDFQDRLNKGKTRDDSDYVWGSIHMPWLTIRLSDDGSSGKIIGHEGRHRAAALMKAGVDQMQIALQIKAGADMFPDVYGKEYHITSEHLPARIEGQYTGTLYDTSSWKVIKDDMQKHVRGR